MEVAVVGLRSRYATLLAEAPDEARAVDFEDRWHHWVAMRTLAGRLDDLLGDRGLAAASRVGFVIENRPEHVAGVLGLLASDRCLVTLNPLQPPERLAADIAKSALPVVVASTAILRDEAIRAAIESVGAVIELRPDWTLEHCGGEVSEDAIVANSGVMIEMFTSGTTGPPKRIELTDLQLDRAVSATAQPPDKRLLRSSVSLVVAPLVHIGGLFSVLAPFYAGRSIAMLPKFSVGQWVELVARHRPRAAGLVPAALRAVLDADVPPERIASLQVVTCGTAACPPELAAAFYDRYGIRVLMTYGATEFAGAIAGWTKPMHEKWWDGKQGSVGRARRGVDLRVVGEDGRELVPGQEGILEIRTAQSPQGPGVWVRSSDRAVLDNDGFLFIRGRTDDAIIRGGFKIQPRLIEDALRRHPAVREAAVVPLPDKRLGHVPVAAVEVAANGARPTPEDLRNLCRDVLTPYEVPVFVAVLDELPRTPSAKVSRIDLLDRITAEMDRDPAEAAR
ncbi:long-chain fatty acid--CoA ligase [Streptomyces gardneri]|nr:long-chain fatty acid--CoA ligase [Streptomyces gardneri]